MLKKTLCIFAAFLVGLFAAVLPAAAKNADPEPWQLAYFEGLREYANSIRSGKNRIAIPPYAFVDFNQDGILELIVNPGSHGFDDQNLMEIYTYADGKLRKFNQLGYNVSLPNGYRNKRTGEIKWLLNIENSSADMIKTEMVFDFEAYQIKLVTLPFQEIQYSHPGNPRVTKKLEWSVGGEKVSKKQYDKEVRKWRKSYELLIPQQAYYDATKSPSRRFPQYEDFLPQMLESIREAPTIDEKQLARRPFMWGAAALGGVAVVAAAIAVPAALVKKRRKGGS